MSLRRTPSLRWDIRLALLRRVLEYRRDENKNSLAVVQFVHKSRLISLKV